jgi:hypothetical protein
MIESDNASTGIGKKLAIMKSRLGRNFDDGLTSFAKMGARYWKNLQTSLKMSYINTSMFTTKDNENFDPHLGDAAFQNALIGGVGAYIEFCNGVVSEYYKEVEKKKNDEDLAHEYPDKLLNNIDKSMGSYRYTKLVQRDSLYQVNPDVESRAIRYDNVQYQETGQVKWSGDAKGLPVHPEAKELIFRQLDMLWYGVDLIRGMDIEEQNERIVEGLAPNTNSGYPFFQTQTKDNIGKMFWGWLEKYCPAVFNKHKDVGYGQDTDRKYLLWVDLIFDALSDCSRRKWYEPSINFYRTQLDKVRAVFGGTILFKALGALIHAAKSLGYTKEAAEKFNEPISKHWDKQLVKYGNLPIVAQLDWDIMFRDIVERMPKIHNGILQPFTSAQLNNLFGFKSDKELLVDVIGEDLKAYDTSVIREDLEFLTSHPKWGFIMQYLLDWMEYSEVWCGDLRIFDIFFKSGHPWTSDVGSFNHINMAFVIRDYIRKTQPCELIAFTVLSDDSLFWWHGFSMKLAVECLANYGYEIKQSQSFVYSRDKVIAFLKVLVGYVHDKNNIIFVGDYQSRYAKLAHSEREIEQDEVKREKYKADVNGIYEITGDIELDSFLSKLASFGSEGSAVVMEILRIVKDTALGRQAIKAIMSLRGEDLYNLYRSDVLFGFRPNWLAGLPVQGLLNRRLLPENS